MAIYRGTGVPGSGDNYFTAVELEAAVTAAAASEAAAAASEAAAAASETAAETAETNAETAETNAETAETNAETAQTAAETAQTAAETAQTAAELAETNAAASYDSFDDRYLGVKSSDPTLDNDGNALLTGALYWKDTTIIGMYVYNGSAWTIVPGLSNVVEDTTPQLGGDLDVNGNDVVSVSNGDINVVPNGTGEFQYNGDEVASVTQLPRPNILINGSMQVWQRGTTFTPAVNNAFTADRWKYVKAGAVVVDILQATNTPTGMSGYSLQVDVTTADASVAAADYSMLGMQLEGHDISHLGWGTAAPQDITVSFWVSSPKTGTHCFSLRDAGNNVHYVATYTVAVADTWEYITVTVPGPTTGTWLITEALSLQIRFCLMIGSDGHASADNEWGSGNKYGSSSQVNCVDSAANNFYLKNVKFEVGDTATDFVALRFSEELAQCQRYYESSFPSGTPPADNVLNGSMAGSGVSIAANDVRTQGIKFAQSKPKTPTMTFYRSTDGATNGRWSFYIAPSWITPTSNTTVWVRDKVGFTAYLPAATGATAGSAYAVSGHWAADAEI